MSEFQFRIKETEVEKRESMSLCFNFTVCSFEQDIFRKYPNKYESIISTLCENLDTLDEPEAR